MVSSKVYDRIAWSFTGFNVVLGWKNVKKAAHKVTEPEDITESTQQEEKYSFYSKFKLNDYRV